MLYSIEKSGIYQFFVSRNGSTGKQGSKQVNAGGAKATKSSVSTGGDNGGHYTHIHTLDYIYIYIYPSPSLSI